MAVPDRAKTRDSEEEKRGCVLNGRGESDERGFYCSSDEEEEEEEEEEEDEELEEEDET